MEWISSLRGKIVGVDTAPIIYFIERHPLYVHMMHSFFQEVQKGEIAVVTSTMALLETLVMPLRHRNVDLADQYRRILLKTKGHRTFRLSPIIAEEAARLRAFYNIRTPDSIQIATAILGGASYFLTNDVHFQPLPDLKILQLDDLKKEIETQQPSQEP
jgi:predicted nucleic acid-binding protein